MKDESKHLLEQLLLKLGINNFEVKVYEPAQFSYRLSILNLNDRDTALLIGKQGENLQSLQYILRILIRQQMDLIKGEEKNLSVDVENYRQRQIDHLTVLAKRKASEALASGKDIELRPMSGFERRIIHLALKDEHHIATVSVGEEPNRKIVIKVLNEPIQIDLG
ncbi:MAG: R3H domain-containing nucleic acid-binding protein [Patescibacteria group bacterium]